MRSGVYTVYLAARWGELSPVALGWVALAAFWGICIRSFPLSGKRKGVATFLGAVLGLSAQIGLWVIVVWVAMAAVFRYSSLSSLTASVAALILLRLLGDRLGFVADYVDGGADVLSSSQQYSEFIGGQRATSVCTKTVIIGRYAPFRCAISWLCTKKDTVLGFDWYTVVYVLRAFLRFDVFFRERFFQELYMSDVAKVMQMVKDHDVKFVDFRFTDTKGKESARFCADFCV